MSKILIHTIAFSPDGVSTAYLYNDIALKFKENGFDVVVITTTPHYNVVQEEIEKQTLDRKLFGLYSVSYYHGIKVLHVPQKKFKSSILRILGFVYWHLISFFIGLFQKKINLIISPSPPLTIGLINIALGKLKKAKVIYNVQEIYPDLLIQEGNLKSGLIISILKFIEYFVYNHSDRVTTIDEVFYDTIISRFKDKSKLKIIPNFVDTEIYKPINLSEVLINKSHFPDSENLKIMYAGNIGHAQDWKILIEVATLLRNDEIDFYIIGEGVMKNQLEQEVTKLNLENVHILPYQQRELMPAIIAYSDIQFIFMSPETENHGFPSKVYTIMACGKPMLISSGENTPVVKFLKNINCSFIAYNNNISKRIEEIVEFLKSVEKKDLILIGSKGMEIIKNNYTKEIVAQKYIELANKLIL